MSSPTFCRMLRRKSVEELTGLSRSTIYRLMASGEFPRPVRLGSKAVAWPETDLADWMTQRIEDRAKVQLAA